MSLQYDEYLKEHIQNVQSGLRWIVDNLDLRKLGIFESDISAALENVGEHDRSKYDVIEYRAYDDYFYGGNKSYAVKTAFDQAWLHHQHVNPHHWQYWVLINDDYSANKVLPMPENYILEMIADWWSFSWREGNLMEIFDWYDKHRSFILFEEGTRKTVEKILNEMQKVLEMQQKHENGYVGDADDDHLEHHGILGQKWGQRNGPPYPLNSEEKLKHVNKLNDVMNSKWEYGVLHNGEHIIDTENFNWGKNYRTIPVETLEKEKIGVCWDFVNYQHHALKNMGIKDESFLLTLQKSDDPDDIVTHTFTIFDLDGKKYWMESAAWPKRGIHEINDYEDVVKELDDMYGNPGKGISVFKYNPEGMDKGLTDREFFDKATQDLIYDDGDHLEHHGILGQKWGQRNGPPYPLDRNPLDDYSKEKITKATIDKYKDQAKQLSHIRINQNTNGMIFTNDEKLVGMVNVEEKDDGHRWIQGLELFNDAKGKGLSYNLLDYATNELGATHLSVNKANTIAKYVYDKYGFQTYDETDNMYFMKFENHLEHHGILGQKWGVRRYQNADGSLTEEGKKRYRKTVFVSGSSKTQTEDSPYYRKELPSGIRKELDKHMEKHNRILVGDAPGIDRQVQDYLNEKKYDVVEVYGPGKQVRYSANSSWKTNPIDAPEYEEGSKEWLAKKDIAMSKEADEGLAVILDEGANATRRNVQRMRDDDKDVKVYQLNQNGIDLDRWLMQRELKDVIIHSDMEEDEHQYGVPEQKKFPLPDADHVRSAIRFFNWVDPKYEKELAKAILEKMDEYGMSFDDFGVGDENRFKKYIPKEYLEKNEEKSK